MPVYELDLNIGYDCNFRCKYCFEKLGDKHYRQECMSNYVVEKVIEYINYLLNNVFNKEDKLKLMIFGGEPLLHIDIIKKLIDNIQNDRVSYNITTNGFLVEKYINELEYFKLKTNNKISFSISYDYSLQNKNRRAESYTKIRSAIILMYKRNLKVSTITVFPREDLSKFNEVFLDFLKLRRIIPHLKLTFNIDRINSAHTVFDEQATRESLQKTKKIIDIIAKKSTDVVIYNNSCGYRGKDREDNCITGSIYAGITVDGSVYPIYNMLHEKEEIRNIFYFGNILYDDFSTIEKNHRDLYRSLNFETPQECFSCNAPCRVYPWRTIKNGNIEEFNTMPDKELCLIHNVLAEELNSFVIR